MAAAHDLLFGVLALQNGLIDQVQLVAAFQAWTRAKSRSLAEHLAARGDLDADQRAGVEAMVALHLKKHAGDAERSLAALPASRSIRESLARAVATDVEASPVHPNPASTQAGDDSDRTASYAVGTSSSDGQRFRVLRPHAKGGLGAVFVAMDVELHREVALKQILDRHADDSISRQRFLLEAEVTGGLEHPGIVPVYGLGTYDGGRPYYAMRFIRGDSLKEAINQFHENESLKRDAGRRSLELRKLLRRFTDVCNAIEYAHSRGVLHRDIKPANIIVGKHGETLVVDWGLAKATGKSDPSAGERSLMPSSASGGSETLPGSALGTPAFMSPEQATGDLDRLGPLCDVYSLGATLYCLLTGKTAFEADDVGAVLRAVQCGLFPPPRKLDPSIDKALEAICLKAMALRPEDRHPTSKALADDVERWMADEPVSAWREPRSRTLVRWLTRHRTGVTAAAAGMLMALAGLGAVSGVQARANSKLNHANEALARANVQVIRANSELKEANDHVTQANLDLKASNLRERERFELAMEAIKLFHGEISKDLLLKQAEFQTLRGKLLRGAADFYGKLQRLLKDRQDEASREALGRAYEELGELTISIGNSKDALGVFQKAMAVRRVLANERGGDDNVELDVARNLRSIGVLLETVGDRAAAMASYDEALAILKRLRPAAGMTEPIYRVEGRVHHAVGWLYHLMGQEEESVNWLRKSCEVLERGIAASEGGTTSPVDKESRRLLAGSLNAIAGPLGTLGRHSEALAAQYQAFEVQQKLAALDPDDPRLQSGAALTQFNIGGLLRSLTRPAEAFLAFRAGLTVFQRLTKDSPAVVEYRRLMAYCLNGCGDSIKDQGRPDEALPYFREARATWQKVVDDNPARYAEPIELGGTYNRIGWLLFGMGHMDRALEEYEAARMVFQKLIDSNPPHYVHRTRSELANVLINMVEIQRRRGRLAEARELCDRAIAIRGTVMKEFPEIVSYRSRMGECWLRSGQVRQAAGEIAGATADWRRALLAYGELKRRSAEIGMFEAGCHAMLSSVAGVSGSGVAASDGPSEAEQAMAILRRIVGAGYHARELRNDSCLDPLRARPDFQLLMLDLVFPAQPFSVP